ncbi:hypothetical protein [Paraflavitalea sp. CAU 1676]|uniref:hypothetical protein n=1 Tax=Paraflavitalea sp. CAU 1676 TaxID=3032598 RepID=UPI0023DB048A|nr:hypothetical protein [Paraflavitalea sp. CAU 1676]MDF2193418.1 hypothetical protein [Paraflavitalea sp. CAU 1676]
MKYLYSLLVVGAVAAGGCKKDKQPAATVTIAVQSNFGLAALVENPNPADHRFLCNLGSSDPKPIYNCTNAVYLKNLPQNLAVVGKKIRFTKFKDNGQPLLFSSINHAHELEVYDAVEVP